MSTNAKDTFTCGLIAGSASGFLTHFLDVGKVTRQSTTFCLRSGDLAFWSRGLSMGVMAQASRFATTVYIDTNFQKRLQRFIDETDTRPDSKAKRVSHGIASLGISLLASGLGEMVANPPVAVKNYQIANRLCMHTAFADMYRSGFHSFVSRGVSVGVVRKSVSNAFVLQTIGPIKTYTERKVSEKYPHMTKSSVSVTASLISGGLMGGIAEVFTNPLDRIKTLMQANHTITLKEAFQESMNNPFRGAWYAFIRKGAIRAINWGLLTALISYKSTSVNVLFDNVQTQED